MKTKQWISLALSLKLMGLGTAGCINKTKEETKKPVKQEQKQIDPLYELVKNAETLEDWEKVSSMALNPENFNFDVAIQSLYKLVKRYDPSKYKEAITCGELAIDLMYEFKRDEIKLITKPNAPPQKLLDDLYKELGDICSKHGMTQKMFENYYKALIWGTKYGDDGVKDPTGNTLYNIDKRHQKKTIAQQELEKLTPDEQEIVKRDLTFRAVARYISEQHIQDMRGVIDRTKKVSDIYGLANRNRVTDVIEEYLKIPGVSPPKQKEKALACKGYNDIPIIGQINGAIMAHK